MNELIIKNYINKMTITDVNSFAIKNDIYLSRGELEFIYNFIKNNYESIIKNKDIDMSLYKENFSLDNYSKINVLIAKYRHYL